jgi:hypothetical protein
MLREELPDNRTHYAATPEQAWFYHADPPGGHYAWEKDISSGKSGYFLTGGFGLNALWRITRIQADALNRQVLTFAPMQLTPTLANPSFNDVAPDVQPFLKQNFERFQQAITRNAPFDAIDSANFLAEGILTHCLKSAGETPRNSLNEMLQKARLILDTPGKHPGFTLTYYAYHLAHVIRHLHARLHANKSIGEGLSLRPEVGLNLTVTVSELLVDVGLGKY